MSKEILSQGDHPEEIYQREFQHKQEVSEETFRMAGFKIGDKVIVERPRLLKKGEEKLPRELQEGEIILFLTGEVMGRTLPEARVVFPDGNFTTVRIFDLCMKNPTVEWKKEIEKHDLKPATE